MTSFRGRLNNVAVGAIAIASMGIEAATAADVPLHRVTQTGHDFRRRSPDRGPA